MKFTFGKCVLSRNSTFFTQAVIIFKAIQTKPVTDGSYVYPDGGQAMGWLIVLAPLIWIPVVFFFEAFRNGLGKVPVTHI